MNDSKKKIIAAIVGIAAGAAVAFFPLQLGLSQRAAIALGILIWAIIWWVFKVIPDYVTAMIMSILFITLAKVPAAATLAAFCGSTWWLLLAAFGLSLGITKCGLMRRFS